MSNNVGGSAGDQGFQFQAKIIAFIAVHMLASASITNLEQDIEGIPIAVAAETNGPGDDIRIEFDRPKHFIELQAKKGLHIGDRFDKTVEKIAAGLRRDTTSSVVLAVDPTATSRIRQKLPLDLRRLRQGREDTPHDRNLFNRVMQLLAAHAEDEEETRALAKHLFVYTFDVEKYDLQTALNLLRSRILVDEQQAKAAWNLLVQAGHELISERGQYDATSLVRFIQRESAHTIHLRASLLPVATNRYQAWLSANTATFRIPGPTGKSLPITTAWAELHVLSRQDAAPQRDVEELLKHYHEWERIASRADEDGYRAKDVAEIEYRVVITGGPGAGKSTLCRKLAHDLTDLEEVVMWIDLPAFASRIQRSTNIKTALVDTSTDGFDAPFEVREALLAQALQRWATDHPFTRIVITSRPIGYETAYFPEWEHYDLMPFTKDQIQSSSWELIQALASDPTTVEQEVARFQEQLKEDHIASLAARNPLLLGFLIQLSLEGEDLAQQRAGLYEQILNLWRKSHPQGRNWQVPQLDGLLAWRSLELIGWSLLSTEKGPAARSHDQLVQQLSQQLAHEMGTRPLNVSATANDCLHFWHERGVVDRFQVGHQEVYTFVHATFHDYAAGRYLASLNLSEIQKWVQNKYRDARWREPILLAAGCGAVEVVVEILLEIGAENEQTASILLFAAAALAESPTAPDKLIRSVADLLISCLTSSNPALAYEVAERGGSLIKRMPDVFAPLLRPLFRHPQLWTRLDALYLALEAKEIVIDAEELEAFLTTLSLEAKEVVTDAEELEARLPSLSTDPLPDQREAIITPGLDLDTMILLGAEALARTRPDARTKGVIQTLYDNDGISVGTQWELRRVLLGLGCDEFIQERDRREEEKAKGGIFDLLFSGKGADADRKILETILRLTSSPFTSAKKRSKLKALAVLLYALHVLEAPIQDWYVLRKLDDIQAIEAVLSGYIAALRLDKEELALDAAWALAELQKLNQDAMVRRSLVSLLPKFPVSPEIHTINLPNVQVKDLIRALHHPSYIIVYGAAQLLAAAGEGREEATSLLFTSNDQRLLRILALISGRLWEAEARPLLMKRLDLGFTPGSWWLIEELPSLQGEHTDRQFQQMLLRALQAEEPRIAIAAVHALQQLDISLLRGMVPALRSALLYWAEQGERAKARSFYRADDCPTCRTEPGNAYAHVSHLTDQL